MNEIKIQKDIDTDDDKEEEPWIQGNVSSLQPSRTVSSHVEFPVVDQTFL